MAARIQGTFIGLSEHTSFHEKPLIKDGDFWRQEMADIRETGMDLVIVGRTMSLGRTHYASALFEEWDESDQVALIMDGAHAASLRVFMGLYLNNRFWSRTGDYPRMMKRDLHFCKTVFGELFERYADHPSLGGIYVVHEPDRNNLDTPERADAVHDFLVSLYETVKSSCALPVLTSPFFAKNLPPDALAEWWDGFLDRPMFDIVAMQDGVGCARGITPEDVPGYYQEFAKVFREKNITFWNNAESFEMCAQFKRTPERGGRRFVPAPIERLECQVSAAEPYVEKTITWEYGHFLSRQQVSPDWYDAFKRWNLRESE